MNILFYEALMSKQYQVNQMHATALDMLGIESTSVRKYQSIFSSKIKRAACPDGQDC